MIRRGVLALFALPSLLGLAVISSQTVHASDFNPGKIIDDSIFTNATTMSPTQIQSFLNSKVSTCDTAGTMPASDFGRSDITHAQYAALRGWSAPPYTCLKDYTENGTTSSQLIYNLSQQYKINPQVFLVLLQKESGLVTDYWPLPSQYRTATGYGCPDSGPNNSANCSSTYYGFTNQLTWTAKMFRAVLNQSPTWYSPYVVGNNFIQWSPNANCGGSVVNIQNWSTAALYDYTPYQPNQSALNAGYGTGDSCAAYGNRNFYLFFNDWFGSSIERYMIDGLSYTPVFDPVYYLANYPDVKSVYGDSASAAFSHFTKYGLVEGRQANAVFNVTSYKNANQDLRIRFRNDLPAYYRHFAAFGKSEGRISSGPVTTTYITSYKGTSYSPIYDYTTYLSQNPDLQKLFAQDDAGAIEHFVEYGMKEGRNASLAFNVNSYIGSYYDLRRVFGDDLTKYYLHYLFYGRFDGRTGVGAYVGGEQTLNATNFSDVYNFDYYRSSNPDILTAYKLDDLSALKHFVYFGMTEGRKASQMFDVAVYKNRYPDLQKAFGNNLKSYYLHYLFYGKKEGRTAI
jgi:hypothetical protein